MVGAIISHRIYSDDQKWLECLNFTPLKSFLPLNADLKC